MSITTGMIKELRDATSLGIADCKKALEQTGGDFDAAIKILREKGAAVAAKRASKEANEGKIDAIVSADSQQAAMIEVNCETDFVTRNDDFQAFVGELINESLHHESGTMADAVADKLEEKIAQVGEKISLRRNEKWSVGSTGAIASYIHMGGKVGVLIELSCEKTESVSKADFQELAKDLTLHVAAAAPEYLSRDEVPSDQVENEKDIFRKQLTGKPDNIIDKILVGKVNKYFSQICFLEQGFVKEEKQSITDLIAEKSKAIDDTIQVKRYIRFQLGGE
ncbi:MAG: translation elongation factor Ts [Pontiellaceae bacterium]